MLYNIFCLGVERMLGPGFGDLSASVSTFVSDVTCIIPVQSFARTCPLSDQTFKTCSLLLVFSMSFNFFVQSFLITISVPFRSFRHLIARDMNLMMIVLVNHPF